MGQVSCASCDCAEGDLKTEMDLKSSIIKSFHQHQDSDQRTQTSVGAEVDQWAATHVDQIVTIQALWRGRQERRAIQHLLKSQQAADSYFARVYVIETLRVGRTLPVTVEARGIYRYNNGAMYEGQWLGGFRHGIGVMTWPDEARFEGHWSFGHPIKLGKFTLPGGEAYIGQWKHSKSSLRLSLLLDAPNQPASDGFIWLAQREARLHKSPTLTRTWQSSKKAALESALQTFKVQLCAQSKLPRYHGNGRSRVESYPSSDCVYSGEMWNGTKDGWGRCVWNNGDWYEGEWEHDAQGGFGTSVWVDGSRHLGFYRMNRKDGVGEYQWEDASQYLGEWRDNQMSGRGRYQWTDGRCYLGEWLDGLMHGFGVFTWKDGRRYEGGWFQGKKHGEGVTYTSDGRYSRDLWKHGKLLKADV